MRNGQVQVALALTGLLFACFSAALIIAFAVPQPKAVVEKIFRSVQDFNHEFHLLDNEFGDSTVPTLLRGQARRRLSEVIATFNISPMTSPTPTSTPTGPFTTEAPTIPENEPVSSIKGSSPVIRTIPAIFVGISSSVIVCAILLYATDTRERFSGNNATGEQEHADDDALKSVDRDTISGTASSGSSFYGQTQQSVPHSHVLPPLLLTEGEVEPYEDPDAFSISRISTMTPSILDVPSYSNYSHAVVQDKSSGNFTTAVEENPDDSSISRISTMTESINYSFGVVQDKMSGISNSSVITELSDENRVSQHTALTTLLYDEGRSPHGSLHSTFSNIDDEALIGEHLADVVQISPSAYSSTFEYTPSDKDGSHNSESMGSNKSNQLMNTERFIARIPFEEMWMAPKVVREVSFASSGKDEKLGLHLGSAGVRGHPYVVAVNFTSPLIDRIFTGDRILKIGDTDTTGMSQVETLKLIEDWVVDRDNMVILTICSSGMGGSWSDCEDELNSFDFGLPDSNIEV